MKVLYSSSLIRGALELHAFRAVRCSGSLSSKKDIVPVQTVHQLQKANMSTSAAYYQHGRLWTVALLDEKLLTGALCVVAVDCIACSLQPVEH